MLELWEAQLLGGLDDAIIIHLQEVDHSVCCSRSAVVLDRGHAYRIHVLAAISISHSPPLSRADFSWLLSADNVSFDKPLEQR